MSEWKHYSELPKKTGSYLVERVSDDGCDRWFQVDEFKNHNIYEEKFSREFNQKVHVLIEEKKPSFQEDQGSFVARWMEIPE